VRAQFESCSPFFVTLDKQAGSEWHLRGCIGTLSPQPLADIARFALSS
jgi:AMMECR1 domain-containing protein